MLSVPPSPGTGGRKCAKQTIVGLLELGLGSNVGHGDVIALVGVDGGASRGEDLERRTTLMNVKEVVAVVEEEESGRRKEQRRGMDGPLSGRETER